MLNIGDIRQVNKIHGRMKPGVFWKAWASLLQHGFHRFWKNGGNFIVNVKGSRIALSKALACKIFVA